jgi:hypothetical protein
MDAAFHNAVRASARTVCFGLRMQPLTVGHLWLLHEIGNALPEHGDEADESDIITAVLICSQKSHRIARRMVRSRLCRFWCALWGHLMRKRPFMVEAKLFGEYLRRELQSPAVDGGAGSGELRAPLCWRLVTMLMSNFGMPLKQALKTPVAFALCIWATEADRRGSLKLASERQLRFHAWADEAERTGAVPWDQILGRN